MVGLKLIDANKRGPWLYLMKLGHVSCCPAESWFHNSTYANLIILIWLAYTTQTNLSLEWRCIFCGSSNFVLPLWNRQVTIAVTVKAWFWSPPCSVSRPVFFLQLSKGYTNVKTSSLICWDLAQLYMKNWPWSFANANILPFPSKPRRTAPVYILDDTRICFTKAWLLVPSQQHKPYFWIRLTEEFEITYANKYLLFQTMGT